MAKGATLASQNQAPLTSQEPSAEPDHEKDVSVEDSTRTPFDEEWEYVTGYKLIVVIGASTMAGFLMLLDTSIVATAIPRITSDFHSLTDIGWYGTAYQLASCALQPLTGKFYNQFNTKYTFIVFMALFELGSLLCGTAVSSKMLIIGRAVAGMGGSGMMNGGLMILRACIPNEKGAAYLGVMLGICQMGVVIGPLIGGALTQYASWRWCFYINLPAGGLVILALFFISIPDRRPKSEIKTGASSILRSFDLPGFGIFAAAAIMFLLALEWGRTTYKWSSSNIIGLFCGSAGALVTFLLWEYRQGDGAMIPLSMLRQRIVWSSCLTYFFLCSNMMVTSFYMAIYFQAVRGKSPTMSGVSILPTILSNMFFAVFSGILVGRWGYYLPWAIASGAINSIGTGLLATLSPTSPTAQWIFYQIIAGIGRGCGFQMPLVAVQNHLTPETVSVGVAAVVFSQGFGPAMFFAFAQTVFSNSLTKNLHTFAPQVNPEIIFVAGASGFRDVVPAAEVQGIILSYSKSIDDVFYLTVGAAVGAFLVCWGMGWKSVKKAKVGVPEV
ncbi:putative MFS multidrug transporter [Stipitochalara longipes BDJ]|nr:putative MFS multidrug transporter [Stipitochalara longipes BDJ]